MGGRVLRRVLRRVPKSMKPLPRSREVLSLDLSALCEGVSYRFGRDRFGFQEPSPTSVGVRPFVNLRRAVTQVGRRLRLGHHA